MDDLWEERSALRFKQYYDEFLAEGEDDATAQWWAQRLLCQTDLYYLAAEIFNLKNAKDRKTNRKRWYPPIHGKLCDHLQKEDDALVKVSRGTMKTTVGECWIVQQILKDPFIRIGLWTKSSSLAEDILGSIKTRLLNEKLLELFPDILEPDKKKWETDNSTQLTVRRKGIERDDPDWNPKEEQIEVWGVGASATGRHYDYHYYDDVIDDKNVTTADQIAKVRDWWGAVQAIMDQSAVQKVIGTPWHQQDLYASIEHDDMFTKSQVLIMPGVLEDGTILYPFFTKKYLDKQRRTMGEYLFSSQYCLNTLPRSDKLFVPPYPQYDLKSFPEDPIYYISVDPSSGRSKRHDSTGICVAAVSESGPDRLYFVEAEGYKLKTEDLAEKIVALAIRYEPRRIGIEKNLLYEGLESLIRLKVQEKQQKARFKMGELWPISQGGGAGSPNKADKIDRTIGAMIRSERALFLPGMKKLFRQMDFYNPNSQKNDDDILDAASLMVRTVPYFAPAHHWGVPVRGDLVWPTFGDLDKLAFVEKGETLKDRVFLH
jgi:hypothetical protein